MNALRWCLTVSLTHKAREGSIHTDYLTTVKDNDSDPDPAVDGVHVGTCVKKIRLVIGVEDGTKGNHHEDEGQQLQASMDHFYPDFPLIPQ